jgi:hypothetical protein
MAARKQQNGTKSQNGAKRERIKIDPKELKQVKIVNFDELVDLFGSEGAELFARKVAEWVLTGKRRSVGVPKALKDELEFPEFSFDVRWQYGEAAGTVNIHSDGGDWAYVGESGSKMVDAFKAMAQHGFLVRRK